MDFALRPARAGDRDALEALQRRSSLHREDDRAALLANPALIHLPAEHCTGVHGVVAERAGAPIGFAIVLPRDDGDAELDGLFVEPAEWRRGIGSALVRAAIALATQAGATRVWVTANERALDVYRRCGFQVVGEAATALRPAPRMCLELVAADGAR